MRSDLVILGSILSEKAVTLSAQNVFALKVAKKATKADVAKAVKTVFGVDVLDVNTAIFRGRTARKARSKSAGPVTVKAPNYKKAFVRLKEGQTLPVAGLVSTETEQSK
ncbi:MAG: 50S ribosomal protein L23 [Proteobacteria bacterium]|nr:50S ribosomal protein L23 [Pseudomonadota bacterium]